MDFTDIKRDIWNNELDYWEQRITAEGGDYEEYDMKFSKWTKEALTAEDRGILYFPSTTPTDYRWILAEDAVPYPLTVRGDLYLPAAATAETPVPAVVILHGSGSIRESREVAYAEFLADRGVAAFLGGKSRGKLVLV